MSANHKKVTTMNCYYHQEKPAAAQCGKCGKGLCQECVDKSEYTWDNKAVCRDCNKAIMDELLAQSQKEKTMLIIKSVIILVFLILGLIIYFGGDDVFTAMVIAGIGGIPTAWKLTKRTEREKALDEVDDHFSNDGGLMNMFIRGLVRIIIVVLFGAIAAPILLIVNIVRFSKLNKEIAIVEQQIAEFAY